MVTSTSALSALAFWKRRDLVPTEVAKATGLGRGERILAAAPDAGGRWLVGTASALILVDGEVAERRPWQEIHAASWDAEEAVLVVTEVGRYGEARQPWRFAAQEPALLLQLVRERVSASVVLQRRVPLPGHAKKGVVIIGRRPPTGGEVSWMVEYDAGIDPAEDDVREAVDALLTQAQGEVVAT